ncbi:MAG TPA: aminopeptidase [Gammaproteobacteria bacterium]|nr:aminopeptidase [Gammaproteobacteria bacterium]
MIRRLAIILCAFALTGCATLGYYAQAVSGEIDVLSSREDVRQVINDPATPDTERAKLQFAMRVRRFASLQLELPDNDSYKNYVKLNRRYPVWVVYAAPPFSLAPTEWCYWFVGCVPYRGYFDKDDAEAFAAGLRAKGEDVYLGGAPAYSTLGWFADPLFSNMLRWSPMALAGLIFHELAHQLVYVDGDAAFNESFADTVEAVGVERWLTQHGEKDKLCAWRREHKASRAFQDVVGKLRRRLAKIYSAPIDDAAKRRKKAAAFAWLRRQHAKLDEQFGFAIYGEWFTHPLNNASLALVTTYNVWQPAFRRLLQHDGGDLQAFYADVRDLAALTPKARHARLQALSQASPDDRDR